MQGEQKKFGDRFQVLLLSVDQSYAEGGKLDRERFDADLKEGCQEAGAEWPCGWPLVMLPGGFEEAARLFGPSGYTTLLVDPDGIVRAMNVNCEEDLPKLLKEILPSQEASAGDAKVGSPCPPFSFRSSDGKTRALADYKGRALLIDIWGAG